MTYSTVKNQRKIKRLSFVELNTGFHLFDKDRNATGYKTLYALSHSIVTKRKEDGKMLNTEGKINVACVALRHKTRQRGKERFCWAVFLTHALYIYIERD